METPFPIRPAIAEDLEIITGLIDSAADWLRTKGTDQWASPWPDRAGRDARVHDGLRAGNTWLMMDDRTPVATISFDNEADPKLWNEIEQDEPSVYVRRLVINRRYQGLRIGAFLVDWAALRTLEKYSALWTRVDVWTTNKGLHEYYSDLGFDAVRCCSEDNPGYPSCALFQRAIPQSGQGCSEVVVSAHGNIMRPVESAEPVSW